MISAGLAVEGQPVGGLGGGLPGPAHHHRAPPSHASSPYMTYASSVADTWHRQQAAQVIAAQQAAAAAAAVKGGEFLRPAQPKPLSTRSVQTSKFLGQKY